MSVSFPIEAESWVDVSPTTKPEDNAKNIGRAVEQAVNNLYTVCRERTRDGRVDISELEIRTYEEARTIGGDVTIRVEAEARVNF